MSIFSSIKKLFAKIFSFLKKILKWLLPLLLVALVVVAVFFPTVLPVIGSWLTTAWSTAGGWLGSAWTAMVNGGGAVVSAATAWLKEASWTELLKLAVGAAIIVDPGGVAEAAGSLASSFVDVAASVAKPLLPLILGGAAIWLLFFREGDGETVYVSDSGSSYAS